MILPAQIFVTGLGGWAVFNGGGVAFPVDEWQLELSNNLVVTTTSSATGVIRNPTINDASWTISVPWNVIGTPEANAIFVGVSITPLELRIGNSALSYIFSALVEKVRLVCNNKGDVVRLVISGYALGGAGVPVAATP